MLWRRQVDLEKVLAVRGFDLKRVLEMDPGFLDGDEEHEHDPSVFSVGIRQEGELDMNKLNAWLGKLLKEKGVDIFRMKGVLAISGMAAKFVFQVLPRRRSPPGPIRSPPLRSPARAVAAAHTPATWTPSPRSRPPIQGVHMLFDGQPLDDQVWAEGEKKVSPPRPPPPRGASRLC